MLSLTSIYKKPYKNGLFSYRDPGLSLEITAMAQGFRCEWNQRGDGPDGAGWSRPAGCWVMAGPCYIATGGNDGMACAWGLGTKIWSQEVEVVLPEQAWEV